MKKHSPTNFSRIKNLQSPKCVGTEKNDRKIEILRDGVKGGFDRGEGREGDDREWSRGGEGGEWGERTEIVGLIKRISCVWSHFLAGQQKRS